MDIDENTVRFGLETVKSLIGISRDITKDKGTSKEVEEKIANLTNGLLSLREELQYSRKYTLKLRELNYELEKKLLEIETAAEEAEKYEDENGLLFKLDEEGERLNPPFCNLCFVKEGIILRLRPKGEGHPFPYYCDNCLRGVGERRPRRAVRAIPSRGL